MKKKDLLTISLLGISAAIALSGCNQSKRKPSTEASEQMSPDVQAFYNSLSPEAQKKFNELDPQHQMMSMEMTKQKCNSRNECRGLGGRKGGHTCAGLNACKGQGGAPVTDPNKAVDAQFNAQKR